MASVAVWKWMLAVLFVVGAAFCAGTETALTALGDVRARQLRDGESRRGRLLALWIEHPERVLSTLLIGNTLVSIGTGSLSAAIAHDLAAGAGWSAASSVAVSATVATLVVLFFGEIVPKTLAKRYPVRAALAALPVLRALAFLLWPVSVAVTRAAVGVVRLLGGKGGPSPGMTGEEIEYLIEMGTKEGVLDEVKEELLNSVLEFADRVAKEIMVPRTRVVAIDREATPQELLRIVTENPYSRMPVYAGSIDEIVGILLVREIVGELKDGNTAGLLRHVKPAFFVPEQMKVSRLLKEMQRRRTHLAVVVDEFGGTSGIVTLEDVLEEIVGEIQDEADAEAAPVKPLGPGVWLADGAVPLHHLEAYLNAREDAQAVSPGAPGQPGAPAPALALRRPIHFPEQGDYETLGGFVTATAGRVPPVGALVTWDGLAFTVRAGDERRVTKVEIAERAAVAAPEAVSVPAR